MAHDLCQVTGHISFHCIKQQGLPQNHVLGRGGEISSRELIYAIVSLVEREAVGSHRPQGQGDMRQGWQRS